MACIRRRNGHLLGIKMLNSRQEPGRKCVPLDAQHRTANAQSGHANPFQCFGVEARAPYQLLRQFHNLACAVRVRRAQIDIFQKQHGLIEFGPVFTAAHARHHQRMLPTSVQPNRHAAPTAANSNRTDDGDAHERRYHEMRNE